MLDFGFATLTAPIATTLTAADSAADAYWTNRQGLTTSTRPWAAVQAQRVSEHTKRVLGF